MGLLHLDNNTKSLSSKSTKIQKYGYPEINWKDHMNSIYAWTARNPSAADVTFNPKNYDYHLNPVMMVFIGKLSPSTLR